MILSPEQAERCERLYGGLMDYTARQLAPSSEVQGLLNEMPDSFGVVYQQMIWGKSGDLSIIENFVWDCKSKLSDADVEEVLSCKNADLRAVSGSSCGR